MRKHLVQRTPVAGAVYGKRPTLHPHHASRALHAVNVLRGHADAAAAGRQVASAANAARRRHVRACASNRRVPRHRHVPIRSRVRSGGSSKRRRRFKEDQVIELVAQAALVAKFLNQPDLQGGAAKSAALSKNH